MRYGDGMGMTSLNPQPNDLIRHLVHVHVALAAQQDTSIPGTGM